LGIREPELYGDNIHRKPPTRHPRPKRAVPRGLVGTACGHLNTSALLLTRFTGQPLSTYSSPTPDLMFLQSPQPKAESCQTMHKTTKWPPERSTSVSLCSIPSPFLPRRSSSRQITPFSTATHRQSGPGPSLLLPLLRLGFHRWLTSSTRSTYFPPLAVPPTTSMFPPESCIRSRYEARPDRNLSQRDYGNVARECPSGRFWFLRAAGCWAT